MQRSMIAFALLVSLVLFAPLAEAQRPGGAGGRPPGGGGFGGRGGAQLDGLTLLGLEQVQKELGLTGDALEAVKGVITSSRDAGRNLFSGFGNIREMSDADREKAMAELRTKREQMNKENMEKVSAHLTAEQKTRLSQIELQLMGARAFDNADVVVKLDLTEDQQLKLAEIGEETQAAQQKLMEEGRAAGRDGFAQIREKGDALRKESEEKRLAVLTAAQKGQFDEMKGKPFELDRSALQGAFRGGQRGTGDGDAPPTRRRPSAE